MIILYSIVLLILSVYSYALIDPNLSIMSNKYWVIFRNPMVDFGYYQRANSWYLYLALIILLFVFHYLFLRTKKVFNPLMIAGIVGGILFFSYPFLSHDFFNYIFDAKIFTYYHQNPYLHKPMDFPDDEWLRFMHWTHRSYPYGPFFLVLTIIPSFLGMGKFILNYFLFKALFVSFYIVSVYYLTKINKKIALEFATHPLVIIEGLVSAHNDLIGVSLAIVGIYYLLNKKFLYARIGLILSGLIKYMTFPLYFLTMEKESIINYLVVAAQMGILIYLSVNREVQEWYFLTLFAFLPLYPGFIRKLNIFFFGLLLSYYPYIFLGGWDTNEKLAWKHWIILLGVILNSIYLFYDYFFARKRKNFFR